MDYECEYEHEWRTPYKHTFAGRCAAEWKRFVSAGHDDGRISAAQWRRKRARVPAAARKLMHCIGRAVVAKCKAVDFEVWSGPLVPRPRRGPEFFASDVEDLATMVFHARASGAALVVLHLIYNADGEITFVWWRATDLDPISDGHYWTELERDTPHQQAPPIGKMITRLVALAKSSM